MILSQVTFNGIPVKKSHSDKEILSKLQEFDNLNDMEDEESELAKMACIYGRAFELLYQDEETQTNVVYNSPENMFMSMTIQSNKSLYLP